MKNENTTAENVKRFTVGKFVCTATPSTHDAEWEDLIVSHPDYEFTCLITHHSLSSYKPKSTSRIFINEDDKISVLKANGLDFIQGYTIRDKVSNERKYFSTKYITEPNCVNLRTANSSRLEKFYTNWFEFLKVTDWDVYKKFAEEMNELVYLKGAKATELVKATKNSNTHTYERETIVRNKFATIKMNDTSETLNMDISTYLMTEEQKIKLFKFIDAMCD